MKRSVKAREVHQFSFGVIRDPGLNWFLLHLLGFHSVIGL